MAWVWAMAWLSLIGGGCGGFDRAWRAAAIEDTSQSALTGRWQGTWQSDQTGHRDELRCLIRAGTNGAYQARFHARYRKWVRLSFGYTLALQADPVEPGAAATEDNTIHFRGGADLGWLAGGVYRCVGSASATNFQATYESKYDRGTFEMARPPPEAK
jgi:hypothetical protein